MQMLKIADREPYTVVPRLTDVPTYEKFELRKAPAAKFWFDLRLELPLTKGKRKGERVGNLNLLTVGGEEDASL